MFNTEADKTLSHSLLYMIQQFGNYIFIKGK